MLLNAPILLTLSAVRSCSFCLVLVFFRKDLCIFCHNCTDLGYTNCRLPPSPVGMDVDQALLPPPPVLKAPPTPPTVDEAPPTHPTVD